MAVRGHSFQHRRQLPHVPEGWFDYSAYGSPIDDTRVIAIKTPLKQAFNSGKRKPRGTKVVTDYRRGVPLEEEFTPTQVVQRLKSHGWTLGKVIDLTFTKRYYDTQEFISLGVKHTKIFCPGREIPNDKVYREFAAALTEFLQEPANDSSMIAVHCTHGLNRTGYLVCRYMIENCGYSAEDAIQAFNKARGHNIERENFLEHLRKGCPPLDTPTSSPKAVDSRQYTKHSKEHSPGHNKHRAPSQGRSARSRSGNSSRNITTERPVHTPRPDWQTYAPTDAATEDYEHYFTSDRRQRHDRFRSAHQPELDHYEGRRYRGTKRPRSDHGEEKYRDSAYYYNSGSWDYQERSRHDGGAYHDPGYEPWGVHTRDMRPAMPPSTKRRALRQDFDAWTGGYQGH